MAPHRLAGVGAPDAGHCDGNDGIPDREFGSRGCRASARPSGMATTCTKPCDSVCDPCQRGLLSHIRRGPWWAPRTAIATGLVGGTLLMAGVVVGARWL